MCHVRCVRTAGALAGEGGRRGTSRDRCSQPPAVPSSCAYIELRICRTFLTRPLGLDFDITSLDFVYVGICVCCQRRLAEHPTRVVTDFTMKAAIPYVVVLLLWTMRRYLVGMQQGLCSECGGTGWTPRGRCCDITVDHSRGPHQQCTEPSLTPDQLAVWETVRHLPGVRIRQTPPPLPPVAAAADQADTMPFTLATLFLVLIAAILYLFV